MNEEIIVKKIKGDKVYFERGKSKRTRVKGFKWISGPLFEPIYMKTFFVFGFKVDFNLWKKVKTIKI